MFQLPRYGSCSCGFAFLHYSRQVLKPLCRQVNFYLKQSLQYCCKSYRNSKLVDQTSGRWDQRSWQNGLQRISAVRRSQPVLKITVVFPSSVCDPSLAGLVLQFAATQRVGALASLSRTLPVFPLCWFWSWLDSCVTGIQCIKRAENNKWIAFHHPTEMNGLSWDRSR